VQDLKKVIEYWIPWLARSFFCHHFMQMGYVAISMNKAEALAKIFPTITTTEVFYLFNTWSKHIKRQSKYDVCVLEELKFKIF